MTVHFGLGGSYGHDFKIFNLQELLHFDGVVLRNGLKGGTTGAIYKQ